jgi:hypothetical protein
MALQFVRASNLRESNMFMSSVALGHRNYSNGEIQQQLYATDPSGRAIQIKKTENLGQQ